MPQTELSILTYNIHKGFSTGNRHFVLPRLRETLIQADADILLLQEVQGEHKQHEITQSGWPDNSHAEYIAEGVWPHIAYGKNARYHLGDHGNAILSKHPIIRWENINFSALSWASRSLLHSVITLPDINENLHIICIHLGLMNLERKQQIRILSERIEAHVPDNAPLIIAGDFNDWSEKAEKHFSEQLNLQETHHTLHNRHARTFPAWLPMLKMDRVYYRKVKPISCEPPRYNLWRRLSDHVPLIAKFEISNEMTEQVKKSKAEG
jgi:endonuclease/exonuclease/phosphatase family metal-dependent hydrolase